jgi:hypothetical protein
LKAATKVATNPNDDLVQEIDSLRKIQLTCYPIHPVICRRYLNGTAATSRKIMLARWRFLVAEAGLTRSTI